MAKRAEHIERIIAPTLDEMGLTLVGCEQLPNAGAGRGFILRVYIDTSDGVTLDECARASRRIGAVLDVEEAIAGRYNLEVSSPGINRPLFTLVQCADVVGETIYVKLHTPLDGQRQFKGKLLRVDLDNLYLDAEISTLTLAFANVEKAHVCADL